MFKKKPGLNLKYTESSFVFNDIEYNNSDVRSISYMEGRSDIHVIAHGTDSSYGAMMTIDMDDGEVVTIREKTTSGRKEIVEKIRNFYFEISELTHTQRSKQYHDQVKKKGYFLYCNYKFFPEENYIQSLHKNRKIFEIKKYNFVKYRDGGIYIRVKNPSIMDTIKRKLTWKHEGFNTVRDTDVIYTLLKHYFNLSWSKNR